MNETYRETLRRAEREMMSAMIKQARARAEALPQSAKDARIRRLEDEHAIAIREGLLGEGITREAAIAAGINMTEHECHCDVCVRTASLCPASQSSIYLELESRGKR